MTPSRAASLVFGVFALLLAFAVWFGLYRFLRAEILRERLEALRDRAFDAAVAGTASFEDPSWKFTVAWLEALALHAGLLTASRFLLISMFGKSRAQDGIAPLFEPYAGEAVAAVRRHLIFGCPVLLLVPRERLLSLIESLE